MRNSRNVIRWGNVSWTNAPCKPPINFYWPRTCCPDTSLATNMLSKDRLTLPETSFSHGDTFASQAHAHPKATIHLENGEDRCVPQLPSKHFRNYKKMVGRQTRLKTLLGSTSQEHLGSRRSQHNQSFQKNFSLQCVNRNLPTKYR